MSDNIRITSSKFARQTRATKRARPSRLGIVTTAALCAFVLTALIIGRF